MDINTGIKSYWNYYLELEEQFLNTRRYVNFEENNFKTYSNEFIKLLQGICSEIDVIAKEIVELKKGKGKFNSIQKWGYEIQKLIPNIDTINLRFDNTFEIIPWNKWRYEYKKTKKGNMSISLAEKMETPDWWIAYNKVKHERTSKNKVGTYNYERANLKNIIYALGGLYILEQYFLNEINTSAEIINIKKSYLYREID